MKALHHNDHKVTKSEIHICNLHIISCENKLQATICIIIQNYNQFSYAKTCSIDQFVVQPSFLDGCSVSARYNVRAPMTIQHRGISSNPCPPD